MATITCQQQGSSCLEPRTTLRLKLSPSPSSIDQPQKCHFATTTTTSNSAPNSVGKGGWSFLQSLSSSSSSSKPVGEEPVYVHPLTKRSSSTILSEKSLQLCTENLGNETGTTDTADCGILSNTWRAGPDSGRAGAGATAGEGREVGRRRSAASRERGVRRSFPPPLTTLTGKDSVRVRSHREDGRLVITAVKGQSGLVSCFRADRSEEGRLRLCLVENCSPNLDSRGSERESFENDTKEEEEEEDQGEGVVEKEEVESEKLGEKERGEMGIIEKFGIGRGRCKDTGEQQYIVENKSVLNWEPFWVAT